MPPLQTTTTRDALVAALRREILGGALRPGTSLTEPGLAARYQVARPTVRSALQELSRRNLVGPGDRRSLIVPVMTNDDIRDLMFVRRPLELAAVTRIVDDRCDLTAAQERLDDLQRLPADAGWSERVEAHTAFHVALVDCAGSERLSRIYPGLQDEMQLCLAQLHGSYPDVAVLHREHRELLDAVRSGSAATARAEMNRHLDRALAMYDVRRS